MNKERIRRLVKEGKMTPAGLDSIAHHLDNGKEKGKNNPLFDDGFTLPEDIARALKSNRMVWKNFQRFPDSYKRIRIGWIDNSRERQDVFETRLRYFIRMTAKNKMFGMVR